MLIRWFVSLRVACAKSYHTRPKVERDVTLHRQRECSFFICLFHNFSNSLNLKKIRFTLKFTLKSKNNIGVTSQLACYWLHKIGGWYGILIRFTQRKHDTGFSIRPVVFVRLYCIQIIYMYIINILTLSKIC